MRTSYWILDENPDRRSDIFQLLVQNGICANCFDKDEALFNALSNQSSLAVVISNGGRDFKKIVDGVKKNNSVTIIVLYDEVCPPNFVVDAIRYGATDCLIWPFDYEFLLERIRNSIKFVVNEISMVQKRRLASNLLGRLSRRERDVLVFLCDGLSNKEIARNLCISPRTVEKHRESIMRKTNSRSICELLRLVFNSQT